MSKSTPSLLKAIADYKAEHGGEQGTGNTMWHLDSAHTNLGGPAGPSVPDVRKVAVERLKQHDAPAQPETAKPGASELPKAPQPAPELEGKPSGSFNDRKGSEALLKKAKDFLHANTK